MRLSRAWPYILHQVLQRNRGLLHGWVVEANSGGLEEANGDGLGVEGRGSLERKTGWIKVAIEQLPSWYRHLYKERGRFFVVVYYALQKA